MAPSRLRRHRAHARAAEQLAAVAPRLVLVFDHYERFRLLDGWLRQELVPALPASVRLVLFGRDAALDAWTGAPGWSVLVVVDAVVKSLRRKLGPHGSAIATATGHGCRFAGFAAG